MDVPSARDRRIVAWAGFAPDVDVLAYAAALAYYGFDKDLAFENVWQLVHHRYTHNLTFALLAGVLAWFLAARGPARLRVALLAALVCALHCFFDVAAGGPTWPIYPLWPFDDLAWHANWSWTIGEWPNVAVLFACLAGILLYGRFAGRSPVECFGDRADAWLVRTVRQEAVAAGPRATALRWIIWVGVLLLMIAVLAPIGFNPFG